ncbi:MAG TPA: hypothetical protein DCQ50_15890 [Chryseobacterium sp.]|nr:hypothetical protein [Chryseobacterium sp.]
MKLDDIKRPTIIDVNEDGLRMEISVPKHINDEQTNELVDILIAPTLVLSEKKETKEKFSLPIDSKMFDPNIYKRFNNFTYSLGKMVRLAELNLDTLVGMLRLYTHLTPVEEILKRNADCQKLKEYEIEKKFNKLTFGNLRNILSCIIKTDTELHSIPGLTTPAERKNFTSVYKNYIDDRDYYTHGILFFLYPSMDPILRVKTHKGDNIYIKYEKNVFTDNLLTYDYLTKIIYEVKQYLQAKINSH